MSQFIPESRVDVLYSKFANQPYVPAAYWTTVREFLLNPLYQQSAPVFVPEFKPVKSEFVLDTSLVPPPGIEPGSSDFQSAA